MELRQVTLNPSWPFNFEDILTYLRTSPSALLERIEHNRYERVLRINTKLVHVTVSAYGAVDNQVINVEIAGDDLDSETVEETVQKMRTIFRLDVDPQPYYAIAETDPILSQYIRTYSGLRPVLIADPFESLLWAIIGQQVNVTFAQKLKVRLLELCGSTFEKGKNKYWVLPKPDVVAALDIEVLRMNQFSYQKAQYLISISEEIATKRLDLESLRQYSYDEACKYLMQFKGIGQWSAECVLMRGLGHQDIIPAGDVGLQAKIGDLYGLGRKASVTQIRDLSSRWNGRSSWVTFLLWLLLQTSKSVYQTIRPSFSDQYWNSLDRA